MAAKIITLRFPGRCADCGARLEPGTDARWFGKGRGVKCLNLDCARATATGFSRSDPDYWNEPDPEAELARRENAEYEAGLADGERYLAEKKIYGAELAERFAYEDEFNRYWKYGEDY